MKTTTAEETHRLSCGSLRVHPPHDWLGTDSTEQVQVFACTGNRCRSCGAPQGEWDVQDRLHRAGFSTCPGCTRADIQHDKDMERREDA